MADQHPNNMVAQVQSLPDLIRNEFDTLDQRVRQLLSDDEARNVQRVIITGCGDSHMAGLATELAFEQLSGIPTDPLTAMQAGRYASPYVRDNPLVFAISVSGSVARTREALSLLGQHGGHKVAITANPEGPLAKIADKVLDCTVPSFVDAPGVRSYRVSLLALYLTAIHLGEVQGRLSADEANAARQDLRGTADTVEATVEAINDKTRQLAETLADEKSYVFVADGPNYATALFSAAKVIEAAGRHAMGQDTEEWAHLQYFASIENLTPTFLISPGYRGHNRVAELISSMERIGRITVAVVPDGDSAVASHATHVLPVVGTVREAFSPMVYAVAGELFSAHLSDVVGEPFFRRTNATYEAGNDIRVSQVLESVQP